MSNFQKILSDNVSTYIIAEIGVNHNGDINLAKKMVDQAVIAKADAVKFQTFKAKDIVLENAEKANYHKRSTGDSESHYEMLQKLELDKDDHFVLKEYCNEKGIDFFSTPYSVNSVDMLEELSVGLYKTASADLVDLVLHERIAKTNKPVIISVGMGTIDEIEETVSIYKKAKSNNIILLHCVSNYPCTYESINIKAMVELRKKFSCIVGFSDHSIDNTASVSAVSLGARVIEKHFTLDKTLQGPDHCVSANPNEFSSLVSEIRKTEKILGSPEKKVQDEELNNRLISRKSVTLSKDISKGEVFKSDMLTMKRPGLGLKANQIKKIIGKKAKKNLKKDYQLSINDF